MTKRLQRLGISGVVLIILVGLLLVTSAGSAQVVPGHFHAVLAASLASPRPQHFDRHLLAQVSRVNQIRDVSPRDRYYPALKRLVEGYGVGMTLQGCPFIDVKPADCQKVPLFRGNEPLLRRDFVMALNDGLDRLNQLIAAPFGNAIVSQADIDLVVSQLNATSLSVEQELTQIETRLTQLERKVSQ